jgi:hypothetical protein
VGSSAAVLLTGVGIPAPDSVTTLLASGASGGTLDAHQVATAGRVLRIDTIAPTERRLHISDGSGELKVMLDRDVGFPVGAYRTNDWVRVRGVLVPGEEGTSWELKPRTVSEIAVSQPPPDTIAPPPPDPSGGGEGVAASGGSSAAAPPAAGLDAPAGGGAVLPPRRTSPTTRAPRMTARRTVRKAARGAVRMATRRTVRTAPHDAVRRAASRRSR